MIWPADDLTRILDREAEALTDAIVGLARRQGYADQTSSLRGAWTESALCLNHCLAAYAAAPHQNHGHDGRHDYRRDPRFDRLRRIAQTHHDAGVPLELHNGLFKLYRRAYLDHFAGLFAAGPPPLAEPAAFLARMDAFFDEVELAMLAPWAESGPRDDALADSLRRLTRERDQYLAALESLRNPVFIATEDGRLVTANRAALQTFLDISEPGAMAYRLALQSRRAELQRVVDEILGTTGTDWTAIWIETRTGGRRCFDIRLRLVEDASHKLERSQIILMHDVTELHLAVRKARDAERAMSLFLAAMAHEIRAPLHSVLGVAGLMQDAGPEDRAALIPLLDSSARALTATLDNVLSFSRFAHQAPTPRPEATDLVQALDELLRVTGIQARQQGVPLRLEIAPEVPQHVTLDWSMTQQVLGNLLRNALRHDDGRGVAVSVAAEDDALVFRIADHGPGLAEPQRLMLLDPATELRPRVTDQNGSGLGLVIAQRMTLALGGRIAALDGAGGARIEVRLPLLPAAAAPAAAVTPQPRLDLSCLLVDDDPINALVSIAMLERLGLSVDHAHGTGEALALCALARQSYDLFILDYRLRDGTGADLARRLRRDPASRDVPIFLLSANVDWVRQSGEDTAAFTALLEKPLDAAALARAIDGATRRPTAPLDGLSPAVQHKMMLSFGRSWAQIRQRIVAADCRRPDREIAALAHRLASGAAIFGLLPHAAALRRLEAVAGDPAAGAADRAQARNALLALALPADWPAETAETAETTAGDAAGGAVP